MILNNYSLFFSDIIFFLNEIFNIFIIILILCFSLFLNYYIKSLNINKLIIELILPIMIINLIFSFYLMNFDIILFFNFKIDNFFLFFKFLIIIFLFFILYLSRFYFFFEKIRIIEYVVLILLSMQGSILIIFSLNLFIIYVCLEIQNLCFYVLASLKRFNNFSIEAGLKYFLFGSFSSSLLLFGISMIYGLFGTLDIIDIYFILLNYDYNIFFILIFLAMFFFFSGLMFKLGAAPFHWWIPDVYEGSPTIIMLFFSIIPKIVLVFFLIKMNFYLFFFEINISYLLLLLGFLSIFFGGINAMFQYKIKRFLAYGTIVNIGFILISLSLFNIEGMFSSIFYLLCYIFSIFIFFWFLLVFKKNNNFEVNKLYDLSFFSFNLISIFFLSLVFFSFIGLPPFMGFFGKFFVYLSLLMQYNYFVLLILILFSVYISFYYLRVIRFIYFFSAKIENRNIINLNVNIIFIFFIFFNIYFLFFFDFICEYIYNILIYSYLSL